MKIPAFAPNQSPSPHRTCTRRVGKLCALIVVVLAGIGQVCAQVPVTGASPAPAASPTPISPSTFLPQAVVQFSDPVSPTSTAKTNQRPQTSTASATPVKTLDVCAPDIFSITSLPAPPPVVTITLTYNSACVGLKVLIAPLDGGVVNGTTGAKEVAVGSDCTLAFTFQPPVDPGYYNVTTMAGSTQRILPFQVVAATAGVN